MPGIRRTNHPRTDAHTPTSPTGPAAPARPAEHRPATPARTDVSRFDATPAAMPQPAPTTSPTANRAVFDVMEPIRDPSELAVAWRAVETRQLISRQIIALGDGSRSEYGGEQNIARIVNANTDGFVQQHGNDLKNFVRFGRSALTPYETAQVMALLGFRNAPGEGSYPAWYSSGVDDTGVGGHVELTYRGESMHGIRAFGDQPSVLAVVNGEFKLLGPADLDGREGSLGAVLSPPLVDKRWFSDSQYARDTNPYL